MKFYNRESELAELKRIQQLAFTENSRMTVITGRRRIGKTSLAMLAVADTPTVYLFVSRKNESQLCHEFAQTISNNLQIELPGKFSTFRDIFLLLLQQAEKQAFNLIIDEFQEFYNVNESIFSDMQNLWDQYRKQTHLNLIVSGSIYSLMHKIFYDNKEALFGRADNIIKLYPFTSSVLKQIMADHNPSYTNDDLLALYTFTGGVPKYVELFCDNKMLSVNKMIEFMVRENSSFIEEGKYLLIEEFGKNFGTYFSILEAIAEGRNTQSQIEQELGEKSIGGYLTRLIEDYGIIVKHRPIRAKEASLAVRYKIEDNFLSFWFKYFNGNRSLLEIKNYKGLQDIIKADYTTYSGLLLEKYFQAKLAESSAFKEIGSWWESRDKENQYEIDIVAVHLQGKKVLIVEVKRQLKNFKPDVFAKKVEHIQHKLFANYSIESTCLSLEDM